MRRQGLIEIGALGAGGGQRLDRELAARAQLIVALIGRRARRRCARVARIDHQTRDAELGGEMLQIGAGREGEQGRAHAVVDAGAHQHLAIGADLLVDRERIGLQRADIIGGPAPAQIVEPRGEDVLIRDDLDRVGRRKPRQVDGVVPHGRSSAKDVTACAGSDCA
jgi:hypothetical protein